MNSRIKTLSPAVANQIAAGEVIEKPASVVKELLENAFDAGADSIVVEISCGGLTSIKVSDNGAGIGEDDLPLSVAAHATSKIEQLYDLYSISSMGFRGEALASIASIAKLYIRSKTSDQTHAMLLYAEHGQISLSPCARNTGTTIDVRDLFYNVPVRKKFLKTERLEFLAIDAVVRRFAMSVPSVAIKLIHNGKKIIDLPLVNKEQSQFNRMRRLFGQAFVKDAIYMNVERSGLQLQGWISGQHYQRSQNDRQWVYINQRIVRDKLIQHAVKQAYEGSLHPGRFPSCLLYFSLPANEVDVNVHPAKHEVRFQQPRFIHDFFTSQLGNALSAQDKTKINEQEQEDLYPVSRLHMSESFAQRSSYSLPKNNASWISLNKQFALIYIDNSPCLLDAQKLHQHWLYMQLKVQTRPLASRSLLVPIAWPVDSEMLNVIIAGKAIFNEAGIHLEMKSTEQLLVKTLPVPGSQLDVGKLLLTVCKQDINYDHLLLNISLCQSFDAYQLTEEEKNELYGFLLEMKEDEFHRLNCSKRLDEDHCQGMFHV